MVVAYCKQGESKMQKKRKKVEPVGGGRRNALVRGSKNIICENVNPLGRRTPILAHVFSIYIYMYIIFYVFYFF